MIDRQADGTALDITALSAATEWRLLSLFFERPRPEWVQEIRGVANEVADPALQKLAAEAEATTAGAYLAVLGPGGLAPAREAGYRPRNDPGRILAQLETIYAAFGFRPRAEDPPDHVAVEVAFVAYLFLKEAYALSQSDSSAAAVCRKAREFFQREHLCWIGAPLWTRLKDMAYPMLVEAAAQLAARLGPAPSTSAPGASDDDADFSCGTACGS